MYAEFGPDGTNQIVVLFYEDDITTTLANLHGTGSNTWGDWVTEVPYPIINGTESLPSEFGDAYPTVSVICATDKRITANLFYSQVWEPYSGYIDIETSLQNMRTAVQDAIDSCGLAFLGIQKQLSLNATLSPNPAESKTTISFTSPDAGEAIVAVYAISEALISTTTYSQQSGLNAIEVDLSTLDKGTYFVTVKNTFFASDMLTIIKQ